MTDDDSDDEWPARPAPHDEGNSLKLNTPAKTRPQKSATETTDEKVRPATPKTAIKPPQSPTNIGVASSDAHSATDVEVAASDDDARNASSTKMRDDDAVPAATESPQPEGAVAAPAPAKKKRPAPDDAPRAKKKKKKQKQKRRDGSKRERVPEEDAVDRCKKVRSSGAPTE